MAPGRGAVCACADDIGLALMSVRSLPIVSEIFAHAEYLTSLKLKPTNCVLVPLSRCVPRDFVLRIAGRFASLFLNIAEFSDLARWCSLWLAQFLPACSSFQVASEVLYLGAFLGPEAGRLQWGSAANKWPQRARDIANTSAPPVAAVSLYKSRAMPALGFLCQLFLPPALAANERVVIASILKLPYNAFSLCGLLNLWQWGGCRVHSLLVTAFATLARSAARTATIWPETLEFLTTVANDQSEPLPFIRVWQGTPWECWWDSQPIAYTLSLAAAALPRHPLVCHCLPRILEEVRAEETSFFSESLPARTIKKFRFQKAVSSRRLAVLYPDDIRQTIRNRVG